MQTSTCWAAGVGCMVVHGWWWPCESAPGIMPAGMRGQCAGQNLFFLRCAGLYGSSN
eukprot:COSAG04_NODE_8541_length_960_cov_1.191638_1_plen_56_part_01